MQNRLDNKQQAIIPIAAFAAKGDTEKLAAEIQHGLDTGLTINEIKEVLIQLYAYAGFPTTQTVPWQRKSSKSPTGPPTIKPSSTVAP